MGKEWGEEGPQVCRDTWEAEWEPGASSLPCPMHGAISSPGHIRAPTGTSGGTSVSHFTSLDWFSHL